MAKAPVFVLEEAFPEKYADALERVLETEKQIRRLNASRVVDLMLAHDELVRPVNFGNRMLAERSFRAEVAALLRITEKAAENLIGYSKVMSDAFPATLGVLRDGEISWQHATVIVDELGGLEQRARGILEHAALERAAQLTPNQLGRVVRLEREKLHPETIPERHDAARRLRGISVADGRDGQSTMFYTDSSVLVHAIFDKLTRGAKGIDTPTDERTLDQRRADLFAHFMLASIDGVPSDVVPDEFDDESFVRWFRGVRAEVVVSVPVLTLLGESEEPATLNGWIPIDPATARILAANTPGFTRILTHPETGVTLSVGRDRYKVPGGLKRFLRIRDLTCRFPGCTRAAELSDIDHTVEWQYGGETNHTNLAHLCRAHHRIKDSTPWTLRQSTDGSSVMTWTSPAGRSYITYPHNPIAA